jgi:hypothetical protein
MNDTTKREASFSTPQRPRSPRVPVNFAVELEGRSTTGGKPFHLAAEAIKVSRGGATLVTDAPVDIGAVILLTPPFGRPLEAEVNGVWMDTADGKQRVGIKLLDVNGWFAE